MAKTNLTHVERKLLRYPPTESTWLCEGKWTTPDGETIFCRSACAGSYDTCFLCGTKKRRKPKLLWPTYVAICERIGHTPGVRWREGGEDGAGQAQAPPVKRKIRRGRS